MNNTKILIFRDAVMLCFVIAIVWSASKEHITWALLLFLLAIIYRIIISIILKSSDRLELIASLSMIIFAIFVYMYNN